MGTGCRGQPSNGQVSSVGRVSFACFTSCRRPRLRVDAWLTGDLIRSQRLYGTASRRTSKLWGQIGTLR